MRLVLIGDIHLYTTRVSKRRLLMSKRILGHTNLMLTRRHRFFHAMMPAIIERACSLKPDAALFSGDISTTSLEDEFEEVAKLIKPLSDTTPTVFVPGNHDRYTFGSKRAKRVEQIMGEVMPGDFPAIRSVGDHWKLMALDCAIPQVWMSRGALGEEQLAGVKRELAALNKDEGLIVLCHYPVEIPARVPKSWMHDMREAKALRELLADCPARVVYMHGHIHKPWVHRPGEGGAINGKAAFTSVNAGSPCMTSDKWPLGQGFWEIELPEDPWADLTYVHHHAKPKNHASEVPPQPLWETKAY